LATPAAIGFFLAHLGLQTAEGIGVVVADIATGLTLGGCPEEKRTPMTPYTVACQEVGFCKLSDSYTCDELGGQMESGTVWMGILGTAIMAILLAYKVNSSFIIGIAFVTILSWFRNTAITYFPDNDAGDARFEYFKKIASIEKMDLVTNQYAWDEAKGGDFVVALFTLLYVDFLDTSGTLLALVSSMGFVDEDGDFPNSRAAFSVDAIATIFGSIFGLSPVTSYIESAAGVEIGSRTGLTSVVVAFFFFLSIFFAPILASIPPWATGGSLIIVGALMARSLAKVKWDNPAHAITAFVTVVMMPLTYSIAYGLIAGIGMWIVLKGTFLLLSLVGIPDPTAEGDETEKDTDDEKKEKFDDDEEDEA
jgi:AGZA family xanthine/uracil permease-like MFS transporter